jgi:phosphate butyryltransferase
MEKKMRINCHNDLKIAAQGMKEKSRIAVIGAQDEHTLDAIVAATNDHLIEPILIGDVSEIKRILAEIGDDPEQYEIVSAKDIDECIRIAVEMVHSGEANILMKGKLETAQMMRAILKKENDLVRGGTLSVVAFYELPSYHKIFAVSDVAINTYPDLSTKKAILENAVSVFHSLGVNNPKVAVLASVENVNPKMPETVDADALKMMNESGEITGCIVEGPISFDLATDKEAARIKNYNSPVAGDADLLLVHELTAGNVLAKALTGLAGATTAGNVVGALIPIVLTSRSAEASDKYYSIALAACSVRHIRS